MEKLREIIFDTETTGLKANDGDRVIEIGAVELINRFPTGAVFHEYINPDGREVHPDALRVHGISNDQLTDKPLFRDIVEKFMDFFGEGKLVAHNASFDVGFINAELARLERPPLPASRIVDTLQIARRNHPGAQNSLDALCARYGIDNSHREKHGALLDSEILAEVYIELLGGRQTKLALDPADDDGKGVELSSDGHEIAAKRPEPLAPRLTAEEVENHRAFIADIGEHAIWNR